MYPIPKEWQRDATQQSHFSVAASKVDGKAWVKNSDGSQIMRLDIATGEYENLGTFRNPKTDRPIGIYGIYADQQNNCYILEFQAGGIGKIDAKTGKLSFYPTPTPYARARRGRVDAQNRLWFAEFGGNAIGMFDPETEKITEYRNPLQWEAPYDVVADRNGDAWEVNETSDRVGRLDPRTAEITNYLLPRNGNIRRVFVDDRSNPVTVWIGNNLAASIVKIEPLDWADRVADEAIASRLSGHHCAQPAACVRSEGPGARGVARPLCAAFGFAVHQPDGCARLRLRAGTAGRVYHLQQAVQQGGGLRPHGPIEVIGEVFGISINGFGENFAFGGVGGLDHALDGIEQLVNADHLVFVLSHNCLPHGAS